MRRCCASATESSRKRSEEAAREKFILTSYVAAI